MSSTDKSIDETTEGGIWSLWNLGCYLKKRST